MTRSGFSLDGNFMGLGWYMRRTEDAARLAAFYGDVLGLPLLRGMQPVFMFWAGETLVFELKSDEAPGPAREENPESASCTPVFRTEDLGGLLARLKAARVPLVSRRIETGYEEAFVLDPDRQLIGFRQLADNASCGMPPNVHLPYDVGCGPMPRDVTNLGWIVTRYADPQRAAGFYASIAGFSLRDRSEHGASIDFGEVSTLEIKAGGAQLPAPKDRCEVRNSYILRAQATAPIKSHLEASGVHFPNPHIQWKRAHLMYFLDPENHIVGIEERYHPSRYPPGIEAYAEDMEAERRFHASGGNAK